MHTAISTELSMLKARFPNIEELTLDEYAEYFGISRGYASQHFMRMNEGNNKINHKRIGRFITIPLMDFAFWLAQQKVVNGRQLNLTSEDLKRRRGYTF